LGEEILDLFYRRKIGKLEIWKNGKYFFQGARNSDPEIDGCKI
jgi:hypothetical protein